MRMNRESIRQTLDSHWRTADAISERDFSITAVDAAFSTTRSRTDDAKSVIPWFCGGFNGEHLPRRRSARLDRKVDVVYGRKFGMALTMDVFTPKANANGAAIVWVVSGGWFSSHEAINPGFIARAAQARLHGLRRRPRQPAEVHDSRDRQGHEPGRALHPVSCEGLSHRPGPDRDHRRARPAGTCR